MKAQKQKCFIDDLCVCAFVVKTKTAATSLHRGGSI